MTVFVDNTIKKPSFKDSYTQQQQDEFFKCALDPEYFIENYVKIISEEGAVPFILYDYQRDALKNIKENKHNIMLFSRQLGKTALASAYLLWYATFHKHKTVLVVANNLKAAVEILERIKFSYKELPNYIRDSVVEFNKTSMVFGNGSRIVCRATSPDSARGLTVNLLYCLDGETKVKIRNKNTGEIKDVSLEELYELLPE